MAKENQPKSEEQLSKPAPNSPLTANLAANLNEIAFRNSQIKQMMGENPLLKKQLGNRGRSANRNQAGDSVGLSGLSRLGSAPEMPSGYSKKKR